MQIPYMCCHLQNNAETYSSFICIKLQDDTPDPMLDMFVEKVTVRKKNIFPCPDVAMQYLPFVMFWWVISFWRDHVIYLFARLHHWFALMAIVGLPQCERSNRSDICKNLQPQTTTKQNKARSAQNSWTLSVFLLCIVMVSYIAFIKKIISYVTPIGSEIDFLYYIIWT